MKRRRFISLNSNKMECKPLNYSDCGRFRCFSSIPPDFVHTHTQTYPNDKFFNQNTLVIKMYRRCALSISKTQSHYMHLDVIVYFGGYQKQQKKMFGLCIRCMLIQF